MRQPFRIIAIALWVLGQASAWAHDSDPEHARRHQLLIFFPDAGLTPQSMSRVTQLLPEYTLQPLSTLSHQARLDREPGDWWLASPSARLIASSNPWDEAYAAERRLYQALYLTRRGRAEIYIEPNTESRVPIEPAAAGPLPPSWPNGDRFAWHLEDQYSELARAREEASTNGCTPRITLLDTGIWPAHSSTPRGLQSALQYNFFDGAQRGWHNVTDPGTSSAVMKNPTHGTGTIGLLAGGRVFANENPDGFSADLGGAPDAQIVPVRISDSVVHFWSKEMAEGLQYAAHLPDAGSGKFCDVVSISAGGLPSRAWATAVNQAYERGIVIVAASGDNFAQLPTHFSVYPSRFSRVVIATGAMADYTPYLAPKDHAGSLQGNYGPASVMKRAIAAYTPNVPWPKWGTRHEYNLNGAGTSAATPQIAAAFALWLQTHAIQDHLTPGPDWVEASMQAIFSTADRGKTDSRTNATYFGNGQLKANQALKLTSSGPFKPQAPAEVRFPFWRILFGLSEPDAMSARDKMLELEALQIAMQSPRLVAYTDDLAALRQPTAQDKSTFIAELLAEKNLSNSLRLYLSTHPVHHDNLE